MGRKKNDSQRHEIIKVSYRLFMEGDYESITTRKIAEECGIERALLHYYFNKKEDIAIRIMVAVVACIYDFLLEECEVENKSESIMGLYYYIFLSALEKEKGLKRIYIMMLGSACLLVEAIHEAFKGEGKSVPLIENKNEEIAFIIANGSMSQLLIHSSRGDLDLDSKEIIQTMVRVHYLYLGKSEKDIARRWKVITQTVDSKLIEKFVEYYKVKNHW